MKQRRLGKTGWHVSAVSMGCWAIGGQWGEVSERQAIATVHAALDAGVNLFDTADSYGLGRSEELLGKALADRRDGAYVATKAGNWARRAGDPPGLKSIYSIINCCHASLYRLGIDTIDLYQCHVGTPERPEIFVEAFELLKQQGKIRHYAISTNDVAALEALNVNGQCAACQINYSILNRSAERDILPPTATPTTSACCCAVPSHRVCWRTSSTPKHASMTRCAASGIRTAISAPASWPASTWSPGCAGALRPGQSMADLALQFTLAPPGRDLPDSGHEEPRRQARANAAARRRPQLDAQQLAAVAEVSPPADR